MAALPVPGALAVFPGARVPDIFVSHGENLRCFRVEEKSEKEVGNFWSQNFAFFGAKSTRRVGELG